MLKICPQCGKEFNAMHSVTTFCSRKCMGLARRIFGEKPCAHCGKVFRGDRKESIYCSRECANEAKRILEDIVCPQCGKTFRPKDHNYKFCSAACNYIYRKGRPCHSDEFKIKLSIRQTLDNCAKRPEVKSKIGAKHKGLPSPMKGKCKPERYHKGYRLLYRPSHPYAWKSGYVYEHRLVMEESIGRYLEKNEVVHHIDFSHDNNSLDNLQLMTAEDHVSLHKSKD